MQQTLDVTNVDEELVDRQGSLLLHLVLVPAGYGIYEEHDIIEGGW